MRRTTVYLDPTTERVLKREAREAGLSLSAVLRVLARKLKSGGIRLL